MKILTLCYEYPPIGGGGGRIAARVASGLVDLGHEVRVVTANLGSKSAHETIDGVEVIRCASFRRRADTCTVAEMAFFLFASFLPSLRLIRKWKPDIIHAHFVVPTGALAWALSLATGTRYALTAHLGDVPGGVPEQTEGLFRIVGPLMKPIWRRATRVSAVSRFVCKLVKAAGRDQCDVILNGVPPLAGKPALASRTEPGIVMVGRLSVQKDPLLAIASLAPLRDLGWTFHVIGDGPLRESMEAESRHQGLKTVFHGWLGAADVARLLGQSDILLMTSRHEGLPVAAIEALQYGLAIVGSRIEGLSDVVDDGVNGFLAERTPDALADALAQLLRDPARLQSFRRASLEKAADFDLEARVRDYEEFLERASRGDRS